MANECILVVDDEPEVLRVCTRVLGQQGYPVQGLTSGREAIARLEQEPFDMLVVDIKMPDVDGLTVLRRGRELHPDLSVLVITGFATLESAVEALHAGAQGFILKPFGIKELVFAVNEAFEHRRREEERLRLGAQLPILEVAQALLAEGDLEGLAGHLVNKVADGLRADRAALLLRDEQADDLYVVGTVGGTPAEGSETIRLPLGQGPIGQALAAERPLALDLAAGQDPSLGALSVTANTTAAVLVPLRTAKGTIGVLYLGRLAGRSPFTASDANLLAIVGPQIATALENARLYEIVIRGKHEWETTFDTIADGISIHDTDFRILRANRTLAEWFGTTPAALIGRHCYEIVHGSDRPPGFCPLRKALRDERPAQAQWEIPQLGTFLTSAYPLYDGGKAIGGVHVLRDITEIKQAEEELRRRNEELTALHAIATAIGRPLDLDNLLYATLERVLEVTAADGGWVHLLDEDQPILSLLAHRGLPPAMAEGIARVEPGQGIVGQAAQSGQVVVVTSPEAHPLLSTEPHLWEGLGTLVTVPLQAQDKVLGVLGFFHRALREVSPQEVQLLTLIGHQIGVAVQNVRLTREAAEVEILRAVDRLRSELLANVSHELRTPLGLIKIFATTLLREDADFDREVQREFLHDIEEETGKLETIVDNLLNLSRLEDGRLRLKKRPTDLGQLAREVIRDMEVQHTQHRFIHDFPAEPLVASVDPKRIEQVLRNVLGNAVKYSPGGGTITVRSRRDRMHTVIQVSDQGIGIPAEDLERVFERFYRVDNEVVQRTRGAGLGLAVCHGIVESHGGRIWAESAPGQGSTFSFSLPIGSEGAPP